MSKWRIPSDVKCLEVNGYPISYQDVGAGPTIVLIHGSITDYRIWAPQVAGLTSTHRVVAPSLRHYFPEKWDGDGSDFTIDQQAADVVALLKCLDLRKVHLLGWSRGGLVAVEIARQAPECVKSLILEDGNTSLAGAETEQTRRASAASAERLDNLKANIRRGEPERGAQELVDALNGTGAWARLSDDRRQMMLDNISTALADKRPPVPREVFAALKMPILLLTGQNSPAAYSDFYDELRKIKKCGPTVMIPKAAHLMHLENADAFNAAVAAFVSANEQV